MLDIKFIKENQKEVQKAADDKGIDIDIAKLLKLNAERVAVLRQIEELNRERKTNSESLKSGGRPDAKTIATGKEIKQLLDGLEPKLKTVEDELLAMQYRVPNIFSPDTPRGPDERSNKEIKKFGAVPKFDFPIKDHVELATNLDLLDTDRGVKVSGFRGYYLKNELALMHWGVLTLALQKMHENGFGIMIPPVMVKDGALYGSGHFPDAQEEIFALEKDKYLVGTSEPSLLAYRSNETLSIDELPLKYAAVSPCYRREIGSYGKDTKGIYRVHEFYKVEQVVICQNSIEESMKWFEVMLKLATDFLQQLELPYRILNICTGDMGMGKYKMHDIETWMPSRNAYGETHSCSSLTDWQARRLNLKYKPAKGESLYCHTLNNTVIASPRILIALLENHQQKDGSIKVPKVLQAFVGKKVIK